MRQPVEFSGTFVLLAEQGPDTKIGKHSSLGTTAERLADSPLPRRITSFRMRNEEPRGKTFTAVFGTMRCGQDIAEYAVMLAVILVIVVGTIRLIGSNANNVFSQVGSAIQ